MSEPFIKLHPAVVLNKIPPIPEPLRHIKNCNRCSLCPGHDKSNPLSERVVVGRGNLNAEILCILQSIDYTDHQYDTPAVGSTHQLMVWLEELGYQKWDDFFWTTAIMCLPSKTRDRFDPAKTSQLNHCRNNLYTIVDNMPNLKMIFTFGNDAGKTVEGKEFRLRTRRGNVGHKHFSRYHDRAFYTFPMEHPSPIIRDTNRNNEWGFRKRLNGFKFRLKLFRELHKNIDNLQDYEVPHKHYICWTEKQVWDLLDRLETDETIENVAIDYETAGIMCAAARIACISISWDGYSAYVIPLLQSVPLPKNKWYKYKSKKKHIDFTHKHEFVDWFPKPSYRKELTRRLRNLFDIDYSGNLKRKKIGVISWFSSFEQNCTWQEFGFDLCGSDAQFEKPDITIPWDGLPAFRLISGGNSMKLVEILMKAKPIEALRKVGIDVVLTKPEIEETGYALAAVKPLYPLEVYHRWGKLHNDWLKSHGMEFTGKVKILKKLPNDYPLKLMVNHLELARVWSPLMATTVTEVFFDRALCDARWEYDLAAMAIPLLKSTELFPLDEIAMKDMIPVVDSGDFTDTLTALHEVDISPAIPDGKFQGFGN
jgi:uracil-DNA glycosylase family 4